MKRGFSTQASALAWPLFALALAAAPLLFTSSLSLAVLSQMGCLIVICLSYNILLGQGGMLSFGHAVYVGLGAFAAIHAMKFSGQGAGPVPLTLIPLAGGLAGMGAALPLGYIATRKPGTAFAMITLGIGELVAALALMFPAVFGGEGGVSANRVYGAPVLGISFGPRIEVYGLIAVYCFVCTALMFAFTGTPLGRLLNAVRDNPERVAFIGYDARRVRWLAFLVAGFFAGVGGGLAAVHVEIVNAAESFGAPRSASYLLFTFLGGTAFFYGPIIGAALLALSLALLPAWTQAWQLYLGLAFVFMVMFAPGGIASLAALNWRVARSGKLPRLGWPYAALLAAAAPAALGAAALIEMVYHLQFGAALGPRLEFMRVRLDTSAPAHWLAAASILIAGLALFGAARRRFARAWRQVGAETGPA
jgi:branched-chain amino acid transport system permease protein